MRSSREEPLRSMVKASPLRFEASEADLLGDAGISRGLLATLASLLEFCLSKIRIKIKTIARAYSKRKSTE